MRSITISLVVVCFFVLAPSRPAAAQDGDAIVRGVVMYLPNRVLDLVDMVRANVKVGQGIAGGVRATEPAEYFIGTYTALYVGLPGPRGEKYLRSPIGFEDRTRKPGQRDHSISGQEPRYGRGEIGIDLFPFVGGAAVGVDVFEIVDFLGGWLLFDPAGDDW